MNASLRGFPLLLCGTILLACTDEGARRAGTEAGAESGAAEPGSTVGACDPVALAAEALAEGTKILGGVTLATSTPMAEILDDPELFVGEAVRIEGAIGEICSNQGCYVTLLDRGGRRLNLKVVDGTVDFRDRAELGQYVVGEGVFSTAGEHGAQLDIMRGGAMIGPTVCPI